MEINENTYQLINYSEYQMIKLIGSCEMNVKSFKAEVLSSLQSPPLHIVVSCEELTSLSNDWVRELLGLQKLLKDSNKQMIFVNVGPALLKKMEGLGIDSAFKFLPSLREALIDFGLVVKRTLDTQFINPFLDATLHVLKVQASVDAIAGKICLKKKGDKYNGDISGIIGIISDNFNGSVAISFPAETFLKVMSSMLGEVCNELNKDIMDGAGEITNMIFGQAKVTLNEKGYGIKTALPSVISGKDHSVSSSSNGPVVIVPFESTAGSFFVEICLSA